jgi:putative tryptophan/tyrosine transport system substrate-binding protein
MSLGRRTFVLCVASSLAPGWAWSQQSRRRRIGWISTEPQPDPFIEGFRDGLRELGYVDGQNLLLELRYAPGNSEKLQSAIAELKGLGVAFIVSSGPAIQAIKVHRDVQVLFAISGDPVELGIADSLARPGGNFTGSTFLSLEIAAKRIELFKEALPHLGTLAVLSNTRHPGEKSEWHATEQAARVLGIKTVYAPFDGPAELDKGLASVRDARADGMIVFPDGVTFARRRMIAEFAAANALPSMFGWSEYCDAGGFMSYGANQRETYFRLASYADRLLRGERPGDLPIQQPTQFELVMNLGTARRLGMTLPQTLWVRADRLVE